MTECPKCDGPLDATDADTAGYWCPACRSYFWPGGVSEAEWEAARDRITEINDTVRNAVTIEREHWAGRLENAAAAALKVKSYTESGTLSYFADQMRRT